LSKIEIYTYKKIYTNAPEIGAEAWKSAATSVGERRQSLAPTDQAAGG
jgi:hypothetical protein